MHLGPRSRGSRWGAILSRPNTKYDYDWFRGALASDAELARWDLAGRLQEMPTKVAERWDLGPNLQGFPDHGPSHSETVVKRIFEMLPPDLLPGVSSRTEDGPEPLTMLELYLLCAAAWVHDIGMQSLREGMKLGGLTERQQETIRAEHPAEGQRRVLKEWRTLGVHADVEARKYVALLVRSHGTKYFRDSLDDYRHVGQPFDYETPVRGPLLAALLLMADEFDLHYKRARIPPEGPGNLIPSSAAHNLKHHFTSRVVVKPVDGRITLEMTLCFRDRVTPDQRRLDGDPEEAVRVWITRKLREQMALVNPTMREALRGRLEFDPKIRVQVEHDLDHDPEPSHYSIPSAASRFLQAEARRGSIINYRHLLPQIEKAVRGRRRCVAIACREGANERTQDNVAAALDSIGEWLRLRLEANSHQVAYIDKWWMPGAPLIHLVRSLALRLLPDCSPDDVSRLGWESLRVRLQQRDAGRRVLVVNDLGRLESEERLTLASFLHDSLGPSERLVVLSSRPFERLTADWRALKVDDPDAAEIRQQLGCVAREDQVIAALASPERTYRDVASAFRDMEKGLEISC